jgi:hypothetical protein
VLLRNIPVYDVFKDGREVLKANNNNEFIENIKRVINENMDVMVDNAYQSVIKKDLKEVGKEIKKVYNNLLGSSDENDLS